MKRYLSFIVLLVLMLGIFGVSHAATVQVGDGTATTSSFPIWGLWNYSYSQQIYTQAQINTSGSIEKIRFYYVSGPIANNKDWRIYMGHTDKTEFTSDSDWVPAAQLTQVFDGDVTTMLPLGNNWMEITLQNPFNYNNTDNLLIAVYQYTPEYATMTWGSFTSGPNTGIAFRDDNVNPDPNNPPTTCNERGATINRIQFVFPDTDAPLAPVLVFPEDAAQVVANQALSWTLPAGSADATGYDVYIDGSVVSNNQPGTSYTIPADLALGTHNWYVVARNAIGDSPASETRTFEKVDGAIIGSGTASYRDPFNVYYGYGRSLGLYTADQIGTYGVINTLGWSAASLGINPEVPYKIYLATTTETELTRMLWDSANPADDCFVRTATLVKEGTYTFDSTGWHTFTLDVTSAVIAELQKTPQDNVFSCYLAGGTGKSQTIILYTRENSANKPITLTVKYKERVPEGLTVLNKAFKVGYTKTISLFTVNDGTLKDVQFEVPVTEAVAHEALKPDDNKISIMVNVKSQTSSAGLSFYKEQGTTNLDYKPQIVVSTQEDTYVIYPEIVARIRGGEYANDLAVDSFEVKEGARIHGGARYVYLKFDISDIKGLEIKNAKLKVTTNKDVNGEFNLALYYIENDDWDMSNLTMNNRPVIGRYENTGSEETMVMQSEVFLKSTYLNSKTFVAAMCVYIEDENNVKMLQNISLYPITLGSNEEQRFVYTEEISKSQQGIVGKLMIFDDIHSSFKPEIEAISSM